LTFITVWTISCHWILDSGICHHPISTIKPYLSNVYSPVGTRAHLEVSFLETFHPVFRIHFHFPHACYHSSPLHILCSIQWVKNTIIWAPQFVRSSSWLYLRVLHALCMLWNTFFLNIFCPCKVMQLSSTWGTRIPEGTRKHVILIKTKYRKRSSLEPAHEDSSPN
jgi:hypothetical protein